MSRFTNLIVLVTGPLCMCFVNIYCRVCKVFGERDICEQNITYLFDLVGYNSPDPSGTSDGACRIVPVSHVALSTSAQSEKA